MRAWSTRGVPLVGVVGLLWGLGVGTPASAAPTPDAARADLNALYARAAESARQFEAAQARAATADAAVRRERRAALRAKAELAEQSVVVANLTIQQLQSQSGVERYTTMLAGAGPREYLERAAAYESTAEAMTARIDEWAARKTVHDAERERLEAALTRQQDAVQREASARTAINAAIAESKRQTKAAEVAYRKSLQTQEQDREPVAEPEAPDSTPAPSATPDARSSPPPPTIRPPQPTVPPPSPPSSQPDGVWDRIAQCESGGNWHINTGNGYYGGLQFSLATWRSVGGPGYPHEHSREVQIHYAEILQARSGWGQWSCAWARHG